MAVDPDLVAVPDCPMSSFPHVVVAADVITGAVSIVRPVANFDGYGSRIRIRRCRAPVVRTRIVIGTIAWIRAVVSGASGQTKRCGKQNEQQSRVFPFHHNSIRTGARIYVPGFTGMRSIALFGPDETPVTLKRTDYLSTNGGASTQCRLTRRFVARCCLTGR